MRPGNYSQTGFLGQNESLVEILRNDAHELAELGVEASELSASLGQLLETALVSRQTVTRVGHHTVKIRRYKGSQICPFAPEPFENPCPGGGTKLGSIDWEIKNNRGGGTKLGSIDWEIKNNRCSFRLSGPGLIVHLIGIHGFFEGPESSYRVAPRALAKLLDLGPFASAD